MHADRMRDNIALTRGEIVSERLNVALAPTLGKAAAKRLLTEAARTAARTGTSLADVLATSDELNAALPPGRLADLLDPAHYTGAAAALVDRALAAAAAVGIEPNGQKA